MLQQALTQQISYSSQTFCPNCLHSKPSRKNVGYVQFSIRCISYQSCNFKIFTSLKRRINYIFSISNLQRETFFFTMQSPSESLVFQIYNYVSAHLLTQELCEILMHFHNVLTILQFVVISLSDFSTFQIARLKRRTKQMKPTFTA